MLVFHLLISVSLGLSLAVASLAQGYSGLHSFSVCVLGAVVGLLASAALAGILRWRSPDMLGVPNDASMWHRIVGSSLEGASQRALVELAAGTDEHRLTDWALGSASWPKEMPEDLRMRLLHVMSYDDCGADEIWEEVRLWLGYHGVARPANWQDRSKDLKRQKEPELVSSLSLSHDARATRSQELPAASTCL